jgi:hypothetical protein
MRMKTYTKPEIEINALENADVITVSGGLALNNGKFTQSTTGYSKVQDF